MNIRVVTTSKPVHIGVVASSSPVHIGVKTNTEKEHGEDVPIYTGEYDVIPTFSLQTLATNGKKMLDDVTVHEIPVTRTSNPYGGQTVLIG